MIDFSWLWAVFTIIAAAGQTARNAMQRELTARLGTAGATHVRFLFGCPFALVFLAAVLLAKGAGLPHPGTTFWPWILAGSLSQIIATALMLAAMGERSFVVAIAYTKTEPVQVALFGLAFLGDPLNLPTAIAILLATGGVIVMSWKRQTGGGFWPVVLGISAGSMFALAAVGYRGAILALHAPDFVLSATFTLAVGLTLQASLLSLYLAVRSPKVLRAIALAWRPSLFAGAMGAFASQFWFLAFALASAASVRTLGLVEVLFAQAVSHLAFKQPATLREALGILLVVGGVVLLLWAQ
jgi:drug/metabolite transporter (DMT)-like permease